MNRNSDFIPFALPSIGSEEKNAVMEVLDSKWLTTGKKTLEFENDFADFIGTKHAIAVNSATAGLHLSLDALRLKENSFIITTPYTFTATAEVIRYIGCHPLFVDINSDDFNIDPEKIEAALKNTKNISGIIPVHIGGLVCKMDRIMQIACSFNLPVIEDCAHAFPVKYGDSYAGNIGNTGVYSFYATKTITTGEGGMVVTDSDSIAKRIKIMRLHGIDRDVWDRYSSKNNKWYYEVVEPGFKYNLTDMASAIGIQQLKKASLFLEIRKKISERYNTAFSSYDFIKTPPFSENHAWHLYTIQIDDTKLKINRDEFVSYLLDKGIGVSVHYIPVHIMPYYRNKYGLKAEDYPNTMKKYLNSISLPVYPDLNEEQINRIIKTVIEIGEKYYR